MRKQFFFSSVAHLRGTHRYYASRSQSKEPIQSPEALSVGEPHSEVITAGASEEAPAAFNSHHEAADN